MNHSSWSVAFSRNWSQTLKYPHEILLADVFFRDNLHLALELELPVPLKLLSRPSVSSWILSTPFSRRHKGETSSKRLRGSSSSSARWRFSSNNLPKRAECCGDSAGPDPNFGFHQNASFGTGTNVMEPAMSADTYTAFYLHNAKNGANNSHGRKYTISQRFYFALGPWWVRVFPRPACFIAGRYSGKTGHVGLFRRTRIREQCL